MQELQQKKEQGSPIFNITREGFLELQKAGLTLDQLFYLETVAFEVDIKDTISKDKYLTWRQSLIRKGYLTESAGLSEDGNLVLQAVGSGEPFKGALEKKHEVDNTLFEEWWRIFPSNDIFEYKGRRFEGVRALKRNKSGCKDLFNKIINEEGYTAEDLIKALEFEITLKKEASVKDSTNHMRFMTNTHSYLVQRKFEGFMEESRKKSTSLMQSNEDL